MSDPSTSPTPIPTVDEKERVEVEWIPQSQEYNGFDRKLKASVLQVDACHTRPDIPVFRKAKKKEDGPLEMFCGFLVKHQIGLSMNLLVLLSLTHICFPRARRHTRKFFELSYYNSESGQYRAGWNDAWMVSFWIVVFTGLRAAVMDYILTPFAKRYGVKTVRDQVRFAEQAWLFCFYAVFWPLGMYILCTSAYWLNLRELWTNWPNREIGGLSKWYTLAQYAFWLQQIMVINIEERRKDHWQMFTHHIVTTMLIFTSYGYHQTRVANLVLCVMDVVDLILPVAKCLKYLGFKAICDYIFAFFMATWFAARHVIYLTICYSVWAHIPEVINYGCYRGKNGAIVGPFPPPDNFAHLFDPFRDPEGVVCWNNGIKWGFLSALLFLQGITLMWFWMIVNVAIKVLKGGEADDVRSDDEGEDEEESYIDDGEDEDLALLPPYEEEVGVEAINLNKKRYRKPLGASSATGVSLPGHSSIGGKELLGRIGCDKGV